MKFKFLMLLMHFKWDMMNYKTQKVIKEIVYIIHIFSYSREIISFNVILEKRISVTFKVSLNY